MDHVAFMQKSWGFTEKIATAQKVIESRWYNVKYAPWGRISPADRIFFKNTGEPVTIQAEVDKVLFFSDLIPDRIQTILEHYGKDLGIEEPDMPNFFEKFKHKRYCILIFLKHAQHITPFEINKQGFGARSSWICIEHISKIKV